MTRRLAALMFTTAFAVAACGGGDDNQSGSTSAASDDTDDSGEDPGSDTTDPSGDDPTTSPATDGSEPNGDGSDGGFCTVNVEGDVTDSWTSSGGLSALNMQYWMGDDTPLGDRLYWIVNCLGAGASALNLLAGEGVTEAEIPFGPKTLSVRVNFDDTEGELQQLFVLEGSDVVWELEAPGVVDITAFDDEHIAGTFELQYHNGLAEMLGEPDQRITVSGEFDYDNPNLG